MCPRRARTRPATSWSPACFPRHADVAYRCMGAVWIPPSPSFTHSPSLPACPLPSSSGCPGDATQLPRPLSHSPSPSSPPLLSLSHAAEQSSSPPSTVAVATASPSPLRHAQKLRPDFLVSSVKPQDAGRPMEPSPSPSSPPAAVDPHRRPAVSSASPSPLRRPLQPR